MANYVGVKCPVCDKKFAESDDIVVCPSCGAPHHRECYQKVGACAFDKEHINGKEWQPPAEDAQRSGHAHVHTRPCPQCGTQNPEDHIFCNVCGTQLLNASQPPRQPQQPQGWGFGTFMEMNTRNMAYGGLAPDETIDGEKVRDIALYVGENTAYYLPRFKLICKAAGRTISTNVGAFFFNFIYYFYRKMYLMGFLLLSLWLLTLIPHILCGIELMPDAMRQAAAANETVRVTMESYGYDFSGVVNYDAVNRYNALGDITLLINFAVGLVVSFTANRQYYNKVLGSVKKIREKFTGPDNQYTYLLSRAGGCNRVAVGLVIAGCAVGYFVVWFYIIWAFLVGVIV